MINWGVIGGGKIVSRFLKSLKNNPDGQTAGMDLSCIKARGRSGAIYGTKGKIFLDPFHRPEKIHLVMNDGTEQELEKPYIHDDFYTEIAEAQRCFKEGLTESPYMTLEDSLRIRRATDLVRKHICENRS